MKHTFATIEKQVSLELEWLYNRADSDLGERSNWMAMVNVKIQGSTEWKDNFNEHQINTLSKKRKIEKKLNNLTALQQQILFAVFGSYRTTYYFTSTMLTSDTDRQKYLFIYKFFQQLSATAVIICDMPIDKLNELCKQKAANKVQTAYALHHLKQKAEQAYKEAILSFYQSKGK